MAQARKFKATLEVTPYFHCTSRCVRGAFLCGRDSRTGKDHTSRRRWLRARLLKLSSIFAIRLAAFAIMENHFHVVLKVEQSRSDAWDDTEVVQRWHRLFKGNQISHRFLDGETLTASETAELQHCIEQWRASLGDISWFMRCTKEPLARLANKEDGCKGRFWEGRFHSQALLDTRALIACMTYVDLNPMRAEPAELPESSPFTSLHLRSKAAAEKNGITSLPVGLLALGECAQNSHTQQPLDTDILVTTEEYLELVDLAARQKHPEKRGLLCNTTTPVLERLGISSSAWKDTESRFRHHFHVWVGRMESLQKMRSVLGQKRIWGERHCQDFFHST